MSHPPDERVWVDASPLLKAVARREVQVDVFGVNLERSYQRAQTNRRVTLHDADRLAVRLLGEHPAMVWGPAWWMAQGVS